VEERAKLHELSIQLASNDKLEELLKAVISNTEQLQALKALGSPGGPETEK